MKFYRNMELLSQPAHVVSLLEIGAAILGRADCLPPPAGTQLDGEVLNFCNLILASKHTSS